MLGNSLYEYDVNYLLWSTLLLFIIPTALERCMYFAFNSSCFSDAIFVSFFNIFSFATIGMSAALEFLAEDY